jgi:hypothetical protein
VGRGFKLLYEVYVSMLLSNRLTRVNRRVDALVHVISSFEGAVSRSSSDVHLVEKCLMQLQLEWEVFIRNFILDCATNKFQCGSGPVTSSIPQRLYTREIACHYLISTFPKSRKEPDWYIPARAIRAADSLGLSNLSTVSAELGVSPWEVDDLRFLRNFIAHRSKNSALKLRSVGLASRSGSIRPVDIAYSHSSSGVVNYRRWASFVKNVAARVTV